MTRTTGAKGKPKPFKVLLDKIKEAAEKEGIAFTYEVIEKAADKAGLSEEQKTISHNKFSTLELELEDAEIDTFKCGNCSAEMASELSKCESCGEDLNWG